MESHRINQTILYISWDCKDIFMGMQSNSTEMWLGSQNWGRCDPYFMAVRRIEKLGMGPYFSQPGIWFMRCRRTMLELHFIMRPKSLASRTTVRACFGGSC